MTDNLFVAGDVARQPHVLYEYQFISMGHWDNAVCGAQVAANNMLGLETERRPHLPLPAYWSAQFGVNIKGIGVCSFADEIVVTQGCPGACTFPRSAGADRIPRCGADRPRPHFAVRRVPATEGVGMTAATAWAEAMKYEHRADPYPFFDRLRRTPVARVADNLYVVTGYREVLALAHDPRVSSDFARSGPLGRLEVNLALETFVRRVAAPGPIVDPPPYRRSQIFRGPRHLPVRFEHISE
ncbi:hypothetical protein [Nocardia testacea]|uniref:Uncharacterized protein n=1 Tax=Nocardia testacea TaxID=248551 RepID=A0ABW7VU38_9NOCA